MSLNMPLPIKGSLIPTLNQYGTMINNLDLFSNAFVEYAAMSKHKVLEIGCAYGVATLAALKKGAKVIANDLDKTHLMILQKQCPDIYKNNLTLIHGQFPSECILESESVSAVLACRILHFMSGSVIQCSLKRIYQYLKPQGKLFVVMDSPYQKIWSNFIPIFEKAIEKNEPWPGYIEDSEQYSRSDPILKKLLPKALHLFNLNTLEKLLIESNFKIEKILYIDRRNDYSDEILIDGRENIGAIAVKN